MREDFRVQVEEKIKEEAWRGVREDFGVQLKGKKRGRGRMEKSKRRRERSIRRENRKKRKNRDE